jgi:hypothetical protein
MTISATTKTPTRNYFPNDQKLPSLGTIQLLPASLPSQEQDLVTGNVRRNITGNLFYKLTGSHYSTITQNEIETVLGNREFYLQGTLKDEVGGTANETKYGKHFYHNACERSDTFTGPVHRFYQAQLDEHHPETWLQKKFNFLHYENFAMKSGLVTITLVASAFTVNPLKVDVVGLKIDIFKNKMDAGQMKTVITASANKVHLQVRKVVLTAVLVGALYAGTAFKPNALPRPSPITPFD